MKRLCSTLLCFVWLLSCMMLQPTAEQNNAVNIQQEAVLAAVYEADIASMRLALEEGLITSEALTRYYLDRITQYDEPYNCFITICDDAIQVARQRDAAIARGEGKGTLFGIPVVIKDNMDLAGYHTTNGHKKSSDQIAQSDADVVAYLLAEGAVVIAKTNMSTDAQDALRSYSKAAGETKNAYSRYLAAGGSSGGSAVSVSLNFAAAGLGTDTNSSLRIPAALAGCVSLRPTFGKISVSGIKKLNGTRDVPGAITRSVEDQAILLDVLTQGQYDYAKQLNADALQGMRIGVLKQLSYATTNTGLRSDANIDDEVAAAFENAIKELKSCGAEVIEVSFSRLFTLSDKTFADNKSASKLALYSAFQELLEEENISAVIYPTYLSTPIRSGKDEDGTYWNVYDQTNINNCRTLAPSAGIPEITVPIGTHTLGAGIGMEIAAAKDCEQLLLDIAYAYTSRYNHRQVPTGAPNDYAVHYEGSVAQLVEMLHTPTEESNAYTEPVKAGEKGEAKEKTDVALYCAVTVLVVLIIMLLLALRKYRIRERKRRRRKKAAYTRR